MQGQEGLSNSAQPGFSSEQENNTDPSEQRPWLGQAQQEDEERPYAEGYVGLDTWDVRPREDDKIHPRRSGRRGVQVVLLLLVILCVFIVAANIVGILISWLSWLLFAALVIVALFALASNRRVVTLPMPVQTFQVLEHPRLVLSNFAGNVSIQRAEGGR